jgi:serine/threonine protein kinase
MPFIGLILIYIVTLSWANRFVEGSPRPRDNPIAVVLVAITALGMNTMHFLARPGYLQAAAKAKQKFFLIRTLEVAFFVGLIIRNWDHSLLLAACPAMRSQVSSAVPGKWFFVRRPDVTVMLIVSIISHYGVINWHPSIGHALWQISGERMLRLAPGGSSLEEEKPGLCQMLLLLSGGRAPRAFGRARHLANTHDYELLRVLGKGTYGVVVLVQKVNLNGCQERFAMKLLHTQGSSSLQGIRSPSELAERERDIYCRVWLEEENIPDGTCRFGHPFIVRLYFFRTFDRPGRRFEMEMDADNEGGSFSMLRPDEPSRFTILQDSAGHDKFHLALMMEYCDQGTLEDFMEGAFSRDFMWFQTMRRFLAEIVLALQFLHQVKGVVYRDLKLSNILVVCSRSDGTPHVKLADFGFSKVLRQSAVSAAPLSTPQASFEASPSGGQALLTVPEGRDSLMSIAGTPYFAAPEMQFQIERNVSLNRNATQQESLDIYSFGVVVFALSFGITYSQLHPRCVAGDRAHKPLQARRPNACTCEGCRAQAALEHVFPTYLGNASIVDLVRKCVAVRSSDRPTVGDLKEHAYFTQEFADETNDVERDRAVNFSDLLQVDI